MKERLCPQSLSFKDLDTNEKDYYCSGFDF